MEDNVLSVSGRLCLFGEHSDWAGEYRKINDKLPAGHCLIVGTNHKVHASVEYQSGKFKIASTLPQGETRGPIELDMDEQYLYEVARNGGFFSYCAGVASYIKRIFDVDGICINNHKMDLPIQKGLSSSAAICVLTAKAFNSVYDLKLTPSGIMEIAYQGENLASSRCGRMDQACIYGSTPTFLKFDGDILNIEPVNAKKPLYIVIVDLNRPRNTKIILDDLHKQYSKITAKTSRRLQKALGVLNKKIVTQAKKAIELGDLPKIGSLMNEAQYIFDKYVTPACPSELKAPRLHEVLNYPKIQPLIWGGKGVGAQGDGSVQLLARGYKEQNMLIEILETDFNDYSCLTLTVPPSNSSIMANTLID